MKTRTMRFRDASPILCAAFMEACRSPLLGAAIRDQHSEIVNAPFPDSSMDVAEFRDAYWAAESWSKFPNFDLGINREEAALEKFFQAEDLCRAFNGKLTDWYMKPGVNRGLMCKARKLVASVLGGFNPDEVVRHCSFGPGATTSMPRRKATQQQKWGLATHITEGALPWYLAFRRYSSGWFIGDRRLEVVEGNRITTVPKNAKTDRTIAIEPDWNMFFQRGIGGVIRSRLRSRLGLLKPHSQLENRKAAQRGSETGEFATLDLSMASDSLSLALVEALLPDEWFRALYSVRSHSGSFGDRTLRYEKISSMGNGYTFELETLIIWALARAVCRDGLCLVYGDDIICRQEYAEDVCSALQHAGFVVNTKKSHINGPFRESCGGHYLRGHDVTPPYFRKPIDCVSEAIRAANRLTLSCSQRYGYWRDGRFEYIWSYLAGLVPKRYRGPMNIGDGVLWVPFDMARPKWDRSLQQWKVDSLVPVDLKRADNSWGGVFSSLYGNVGGGSEFSLRRDSGLRTTRTLVPTWCGPSPWLGEEYI